MTDPREKISEEEYEIIDLEAELHGVNEGFRIASEKLEAIKTNILNSRNKLYDALPSGDVDSFALLKVIQSHIAELDEILGEVPQSSEATKT